MPKVTLTSREMLVLFENGRNPAANLRLESELFEGVHNGTLPETLRFWINSECLVRGRAKTAKYGWYNEEIAERLGVPVFERSTGGGVVYQDEGNLNWSFFTKTSGSFVSPKAAFENASKHIVGALARLGVRAVFSPPNRIDVSHYKISGMAARSTVRALLVHGTLLIDSDLRRLNLLCIPPPGCPPVSNLRRWAKGMTHQDVVNAVTQELTDSGLQVRTVDAP